jgi:hypothetical protein
MANDINAILQRPTCTVRELGRVLGLSKNPAYAAVRRGDFASIRVEGRILVLTAPLRRMLGIEPAQAITTPLSPAHRTAEALGTRGPR